MLHPFFARDAPLLFAHRGGSGIAPENTIAAFESAVALGVDGLELDVRFSKDGGVVVHHDATLERTTNLRGRVEAFTTDELARADAAHHFRPWSAPDGPPPLRGRGIGVPTLDAVLARCPDVRIIIELKLNDPALGAAVVNIVRAAAAERRVCLGGVGRRALRAVRRMAPGLATSAAREEVRWALYRSWCRWPIPQAPYAGYQVPETAGRTRVVSARFVADAHAAGLGVQVWTVDDAEAARRLIGWGVDGLISDRPDLLHAVVRAASPGTSSTPVTDRARIGR